MNEKTESKINLKERNIYRKMESPMHSQPPTHKQGVKYETEEERRNGLLKAFLRYSSKPWTCEVCNRTIWKGNKTKHLKTNVHKRNMVVNNN